MRREGGVKVCRAVLKVVVESKRDVELVCSLLRSGREMGEALLQITEEVFSLSSLRFSVMGEEFSLSHHEILFAPEVDGVVLVRLCFTGSGGKSVPVLVFVESSSGGGIIPPRGRSPYERELLTSFVFTLTNRIVANRCPFLSGLAFSFVAEREGL